MAVSTELLRKMAAALPDPVFVVTESGRYLFVAGGRTVMSYDDCRRLSGRSLYDVLPPERADWFLAEIRKTLEADCVRTVEYSLGNDDVKGLETHQSPAGDIRFEGRIQPITGDCDGERAVVWVARNITRRHALEGELRRQSELDPLTGIANRRKLLEDVAEKLGMLKRYGTRSSLMMFDLDHFKSINDRFGHGAGDDVLCSVCDLCRTGLRDADLFARIGGEEFAVLMPNTGLTAAQQAAERLRQKISRAVIHHDEDEIRVAISVGVTEILDRDETVKDILRRADAALYQAKHAGRDRVVAE